MGTPKVIHMIIHPGKRVTAKLPDLVEPLEGITDPRVGVQLGDHNNGARSGADRLLYVPTLLYSI